MLFVCISCSTLCTPICASANLKITGNNNFRDKADSQVIVGSDFKRGLRMSVSGILGTIPNAKTSNPKLHALSTFSSQAPIPDNLTSAP